MAGILIVEDETIVGEDMRKRLESLGYTVVAVVSSGEEAIREAEGNDLNLVLMDIVLKGDIDGIKTAEIIHTRFGVPVVYITAYADEKLRERAEATQPSGYILKPLENRELCATVEKALKRCEKKEE